MFLSLLAVAILVVIITTSVWESLKRIELEGGTLDPQMLTNPAMLYSAQNAFYGKLCSFTLLVCWIFSIIDAYRIGKRRNIDTGNE